ncbi:MAG: M23 family metallopeptidase [Pseudomonadota bacterium]
MRLLFRLFFPAFFMAIGWIVGAKFGAPDYVLDTVDRYVKIGADEAREAASGFAGDAIDAAEGALSSLEEEQVYDSDADGGDEKEPSEEDRAVAEAAPVLKRSFAAAPMADRLQVCRTRVSNSPAVDAEGYVRDFKKRIDVDGVALLLAPVTKACLSSGYGPRGSRGKLHAGVDFFSDSGGEVLAAGDGVVVEAVYRDDYGNMVVIDHGGGVYTRYAHLQRFYSGMKAGRAVKQGMMLGPIGNSGAYTTVVHVHYEILRGDYDTPKKSFGLTPVDPFSFPKAQ